MLNDIIENSLSTIKTFLEHVKNPYVSCSFGKDSLVVLHLVRQIRPNIPILYVNTGVEYPSVVKLAHRLKNEWQLNLIEVKPEETFWWVVENYGWPIGARDNSRGKEANAVYACCNNLKKIPLKKATKKKYDSYFDGLTSSESATRMTLSIRMERNNQKYFYKKTVKQWVCHPIIDWRVYDVWQYIQWKQIPYPEVYDQEIGDYTKLGYVQKVFGHELDRCIRVGCMVCPLPILYTPGPLAQLRIFYPKVWEMLMKKGLAQEILKRKLGIEIGKDVSLIDSMNNINWWLKERPCWFDKV